MLHESLGGSAPPVSAFASPPASSPMAATRGGEWVNSTDGVELYRLLAAMGVAGAAWTRAGGP